MLPIFALLCLSLPQDARPVASDWPQWRGPERSGISPETGWSSAGAEAPLWTRAVGIGYSSPSVVGAWLYTIGFDEKHKVDATVCLDAATGAERWRHTLPAELWDDMHGGGSLTSPAVAGGTVYVLSRMGPLVALSAEDGREHWRRPLQEELGVELGPFGFSSSPLVLDEAVVVNVGRTAAFERHTGKPLWSTRDYAPS